MPFPLNPLICVVGLGYVGLPLAVLLGRRFSVVGFDISERRVSELRRGFDRTGEISSSDIASSGAYFTTSPGDSIACADVVIVTVPTPIDRHKNPDLGPLRLATKTIGKHMKKGTLVVYESTVYPGVTEEICVPILENESGLRWKVDFHVGYSPERVNPGDKEHTIDKIVKVVAGDTPETTDYLAWLYGSVVEAGVHRAPDIKTAEAAKVIENAQRDLNIAFVNELALIFDRMGIDTHDVLEAAGTKWNFLKFRPGLVGGHCIGVDPYYLTFKARELGYHPEVILAGRRLNDSMGIFVANKVVKLMIKKGHIIKGSRVLVLGITFKENCPDVRNTRVIDVVRELTEFGCVVDVFDPLANPEDVRSEYGIDVKNGSNFLTEENLLNYNAVVLAVAHRAFSSLNAILDRVKRQNSSIVVYDVKGFLNRSIVDGRL